MRVALLHNRYQNVGGEEAVVDFETSLLESAGHTVPRYEVDNQDVFAQPGLGAVRDLWQAPWNPRSLRRVQDFLRDAECEVGHVHNWFPLLSPAVYGAHQSLGIPVVQTLHNFRMGCGAGTLMRAGSHCEDCLGGDRAPAVKHGCYRGSRLATWMWRRVVNRAWDKRTFQEQVQLYLAPSRFVADRHVQLGLDASQVRILPHGVPDPGNETRTGIDLREQGALFVGRLSREKGLNVLLEAWQGLSIPLTIVGAGPEEERVREAQATNPFLSYRGFLDPSQVKEAMASHACLISPHVGPESFGLAIVEAQAAGMPVVASRLGGPEETILDGITGKLFPPGDAQALRQVLWAWENDPDGMKTMGREARIRYERNYHPRVHLQGLLQAFEDVQDLGAKRAAA